VVRFADESDLLDRLSRELSENDRRVVLILGPDLVAARKPWITRVLTAADEYARTQRNDELNTELARAARIGGPSERLAAYRAAFDDFLGPGDFDLVLQRTVLQAYHRTDEEGSDPPLARPLTAESARILERDSAFWPMDPGLSALGRVVARFGDRLANRVFTTGPDPGIEVALHRMGVAAEPITPFTHPELDGPGGIRVVHLLGYWRPFSADHRQAPLPGPRQARLPDQAGDNLHRLLAGSSIYVLGHRGSDPIIEFALAAAVRSGARVWWAVPDEHDRHDPRIRVLAERIGGGDSVTVHYGVDGDDFLQKLAVQRALIPKNARTPRARAYEQPELLRGLGAIPLRAPAEGAVDLLRQLDERFRWQFEGPASPAPSLLFWPVRLREPSVIHMVQALAAGALAAHGVRVVLTLDDFGDCRPDVRSMFEDRVQDWFRLIPQAREPDIVALQEWIEEREGMPRLIRERPTRPWAVLQEYYGQRKPTVFDTLQAAKILPDNEPEDAVQVLELLRTRGVQRLLTAPALWSIYNELLLDRRITEVMTLAGVDELTFWRHRQQISGEQTRHLFHPRIDNLTQDSGLIRWDHHLDLQEAIERAVTREHWRRPDRYLPWLVEHAFLLPAYLRDGGGAQLEGRVFNVWQDVLTALDADPGLADPLARRISAWFLGEIEQD
jgi:hypothetical protein